jgi:glycine betaine/proline transport system permease protein
LAVLQTLPFFTYLLPAVIFFKVGPTAGAVATVVFAVPPMILMTTLGLQKVPTDIVEAGKMSGTTRFQMLRHVFLPAARTDILVGVNQVIMLCLAMVVLTAFIGMPGLGAKLLALMNSFKLGRSLEIGITIVLLAITLDRLSKAWVVKQPEHFEKETPWWHRHAFLLAGLIGFVGFVVIAQFVQVADHIKRAQDFSMGKEIDVVIKAFLDIDAIQAVTGWLRWFLTTQVLIPLRDGLLWLPSLTVISCPPNRLVGSLDDHALCSDVSGGTGPYDRRAPWHPCSTAGKLGETHSASLRYRSDLSEFHLPDPGDHAVRRE